MTAPRRGVGGCACCGAVTIEPLEVSRWRGGCGRVYGVSMGMCWGSSLFLREEWDDFVPHLSSGLTTNLESVPFAQSFSSREERASGAKALICESLYGPTKVVP